ncbi:MAG: M13 family metallopeptidase [Bacteroidales bacterium]|nr:M13 family metallopeptidase [Bacteroidales bacterium]
MKYLLMICGATGATMSGCGGSSPDGFAHFTESEMDKSVSPDDDFYQYSNGGWMLQHPLPDDKSRLGSFDLLNDDNELKLKSLVEELSGRQNAEGTAAQKIGDLYNCGLDSAARNAERLTALEPYLADIDAVGDKQSLSRELAEMFSIGANPFFAFGRTPDAMNSLQNIAEVWQAGLGLPDRDYYFNDDANSQELREAYKAMLCKFASLAGWENDAERIGKVFELETAIAEKHYTRAENRDPQRVYNKLTFSELNDKIKFLDWNVFQDACNVKIEEINVAQLEYFEALDEVIAKTSVDVLRDYLKLTLLRSFASAMSDDFVNASFDFYGRKLNGAKEMLPLWKRTLRVLDDEVGELLGQLFVEKHFPASAKERMTELIENLRVAFSQRIDNLTWMSDTTKAFAQEKLAAVKFKIGYPDKWRDYTDLKIDKSAGYVGNLIRSAKFSFAQEMAKINKPVDRTEWYMTPQTVNAYYSPTENEIVFPAGILQPPFFYADGDDAVNYGAIGVVIGHEMTHGFDDQGRQFDKDGNLNNWWTESDIERFTAITKRLVERFESFTVVDSLKANGEITLGENIADLGGLNIAYQAYCNSQAGKAEPAPIDGQTADQRFVLAYSRIWASTVRDEYLYKQVKTDPHSPARLRVNAQLPLVGYFYKAFNVRPESKMYLPEDDRITIW